jgi:hypothetical protein
MGLRPGVDSESLHAQGRGAEAVGEARRKKGGGEKRHGASPRCGFGEPPRPRSGSEAVGEAREGRKGRRRRAWGFAEVWIRSSLHAQGRGARAVGEGEEEKERGGREQAWGFRLGVDSE